MVPRSETTTERTDPDLATALRLASVQPRQARLIAVEAERAARGAGDWAALSVARRVHGVAAMQLRDLGEAVSQLRASVAAAHRAVSANLAGEARMSLASALLLSGAAGKAFQEIETAGRELDGPTAARVLVQRAAILQEMGRWDEALESSRRALPLLRRAGDVQWEIRALSNRSLLYIDRLAFAAAEADLLTALRLCEQHGLDLPRAYVEQNLGCLKASRGEVPAALRFFDQAEERYRLLGLEVGSLLVDRARLLLSVRLVGEARATAEEAVRVYQRQRRINLPEALLLLSTAALVEGDLDTAERTADQAARRFARQGRPEWGALARHARLQALLARDPDRVPLGRIRRSARDLTLAGWAVPALEALVLSGRLALDRGRPAQARRDLALASRARSAGPVDVRARAWLAEALLRRADGRRYGALRALSAGLRILEEHRATLGATELRAHVSVYRGSLARLGIRMALENGDARGVHRWAERGRGVAATPRAMRPPADPALAELLADLRATMSAIEQGRGDGRPTGHLVARQVATERRIREHCRRATGEYRPDGAAPPALRVLAAALGDAVLVEYVEVDDVLHAVTVADGTVSLHHLGPLAEIRRGLLHLPFALHRLADGHTSPASVAAATVVLDRVGEAFDRVLLRPLARIVGDRPLVIIPTGALQSLPWSVLPSCAGRPVTVTPSTALWYESAGREPVPLAREVVVIAGPGLPGARAEAAAVATMYGKATHLYGARADARHVTAALSGATVAHVAAHGHLRSDNPFFSSLLLADGPYTVYDLEGLPNPPYQVVLAACDTGRAHIVGEEVLGLASALLRQGTATLVAPVVPVPDGETAPLMRAYHAGLLAGRAPAEALAEAQRRTRSEGPLQLAAAAGFVCLGAGLVRPPTTPAGTGAPPVTDRSSR